MNPLDRALNNDFNVISKSLIPYLNPDSQKAAAIFIKAFELVQTIDLFSNENFARSLTRSNESDWSKAFLTDLKQNLSNDRGYFIDALLKLSEVKDILGHSRNENSSSSMLSNEPELHSHVPLFTDSPASSSDSSKPSKNTINPTEIIDKLSPMLDSNQIQLLKVLSSFIK